MLKLFVELLDPKFLTTVFAAVAAAATVLTLAMPYMVNDTLSKRMKAVAFEREKIRQRERERLAQGSKVALRQSPRAYMKTIVDNFNLSKWVGEEQADTMLLQAGYRGHAPYITYLFFRMIEPAFRKVSEEIGTQSVPLAEELALTTAELSFLPDRRKAYENLTRRTGLEGVKAVCLALQQAERYGTPLGTTMRVLAQENPTCACPRPRRRPPACRRS
jgi:pilus assembly protein TadC